MNDIGLWVFIGGLIIAAVIGGLLFRSLWEDDPDA
jgi:hypothetical protein